MKSITSPMKSITTKWKTALLGAGAALLGGAAVWTGIGQGLLPHPPGLSGEAPGSEGKRVTVQYNCPMHPTIIKNGPDQCPLCGMDLVPMKSHGPAGGSGGAAGTAGAEAGRNMPQAHGPNVVRIEPATAQNMGVKTAPVRREALRREARLSASVVPDPGRQALVTSRLPGWIEAVPADLPGRSVKKGQVLAYLQSPEFTLAQEELLQASRLSQEPGEAVPILESAKRRLANWGFSDALIAGVLASGRPLPRLPITAPISGVVLERLVVEGQNVGAGTPLFRLADLSRLYAEGDAFSADLGLLEKGRTVTVRFPALPGREVEGRVDLLSPLLDPEGTTQRLRVALPDMRGAGRGGENSRESAGQSAGLALKPGMLAEILLFLAAESTLVVPEEAILRTGERNIAIVPIGSGYFEPREVKLGAASGGRVQVLEGLRAGDSIVVSSQFLIDSESNLRAAVSAMGHDGH